MKIRSVFLAAFVAVIPAVLSAGDWPMWRYDAGRGAASPDALPKSLNLQWIRDLPTPMPAWPSTQAKLQFDASYNPVVVGTRMFVGSSVDDTLRAFSTRDGKELWRFYTDGPIRFAPVAIKGMVYVTSDDGHLYCVNAETGKRVWKVNGGPSIRPIIGNHRLISSWPARGGAVHADGVVYFAAGIWPSMGIFIHAVDAETGKILWTNSETGSLYVVHPHGAPSFGSIVPQGHLVVSGDSLIVPGGRSVPAVLDRKTGKLRHFIYDKRAGDHHVIARGEFYFVGGGRYHTADGLSAGNGDPDVLTKDLAITSSTGKIVAADLQGKTVSRLKKDRKGRPTLVKEFRSETRWTLQATDNSPTKLFCTAGGQLYTAGKNHIARFAMPSKKSAAAIKQEPDWTAEIEGEVWSMIAADDRLFVITTVGRVYCFGEEKRKVVRHVPASWQAAIEKASPFGKIGAKPQQQMKPEPKRPPVSDASRDFPYMLMIGLPEDFSLLREFKPDSNHQYVFVDPRPKAIEQVRKLATEKGWYGHSVSANVGDGVKFPFPPYMASQIMCVDMKSAGIDFSPESLIRLYRPLRPYGGKAMLLTSDAEHLKLVAAIERAGLYNAKVTRENAMTVIERVGALHGAGEWSHQYGNASNSVVSRDSIVKAPLGVLWFGGPSHDGILPRHGHGPNPQVAGGRLVIEGPDLLRAVDVYTGRLLWETTLKGVGEYYDTTRHFAGAGEIGSNYVTLPDAVYVSYGRKLLEFDAETGKQRRAYTLPKEGDAEPYWGALMVDGDFLIATSTPVAIAKAANKTDSKPPLQPVRYSSASKRLVVIDRKTGKRLWQREAEFNFRHNGIAAANGKLFCIDGLSPEKIQQLKRRGIKAEGKARLLAIDTYTGKVLWETRENVTGTFLNYSEKHDVLLQAGSAYRDRAKDEVSQGMTAFRGKDGNVLWRDAEIKYGGPCLLWKDKIITNGGGGFQLELLTGKKTGWSYGRMYGCNTAVGSEHLLTFRSGAAGFCDLAGDSGTGNIGGFRSSCTSNLIAADGVLNAPDYTRTCTCAYQNQTSLALIHMPENEFWTFNVREFTPGETKRIGLNLGAPGDRRDKDGTLWLEVPTVGGPSPKLKVSVQPDKVAWYHRHSSFQKPDEHNWVTASGGVGIETITINLSTIKKPASAKFAVRLYFAEPESLKSGDRVFSVAMQGITVLKDFDIVKTAGGTHRTLMREFPHVEIGETLQIGLTRATMSKHPPLLCGIELLRESP